MWHSKADLKRKRDRKRQKEYRRRKKLEKEAAERREDTSTEEEAASEVPDDNKDDDYDAESMARTAPVLPQPPPPQQQQHIFPTAPHPAVLPRVVQVADQIRAENVALQEDEVATLLGDGDGVANVQGGGEPDAGEVEDASNRSDSSLIPTEIVPRDEVEEIVSQLARICFRHEISDAAVQDMLAMFCQNAQQLDSLLREGRFRPSWRHFVRPRALESCPKIKCSYLVERLYGGDVEQIFVQDLDRIPSEILSLPYDGTRKLLRTAAYVRLADIKAHHRKLHAQMAVSEEKTKEDLLHAHISVDGVRESQKGTRSLRIITVRLGDCIYLHSVVNPLIGVPASRPSPTDLLR